MLNWLNDNRLSVGDMTFLVTADWGEFIRATSTPDHFVVAKSRRMIERYHQLINSTRVQHIFELGIYKGGSCVLLEALAKPRKLLAVDSEHEPVEALQRYIEAKNLNDVIKPFYGIDQSDGAELRKIISQELPGRHLDLVSDDASHFLDNTRNSFNSLFPYLRPGGLCVIEDWAWAHAQIDERAHPDSLWPEKRPLTILVFEVIMACASSPRLIEEIVIDKNFAIIKQGRLEVDANNFDISKRYLNRGRQLVSGR